MSAERFRVSAGYDAVHIPFKGGAEALTEVIAGRVDYYFCPIATALPHIREGKLLGARGLSSKARGGAIAGRADHAGSGLSGFRLHALGRDSRAVRHAEGGDRQAQRRNDEGARSARRCARSSTGSACRPMPMSPEEFGALINTELKIYGDFVKKAGLKVN